MATWASIAKPPEQATKVVAKPQNTSPRAFAFAATANQSNAKTPFSWAAKVAGNATEKNNPSPTGVADVHALPSPNFSSASKLTRAAELKQIALDLESSRAGLNLVFKQVVTTSASNARSESVVAPAVEGNATNKGESCKAENEKHNVEWPTKQPVQPVTEAKMKKRQRQIDMGKRTAGYKNYTHHVPKEDRKPRNRKHPVTPNKTAFVSKRKFDRKIASWRKKLHAWDSEGPYTSDEATPTKRDEPKDEGDKTAAAESKRVLRATSWADMADSDSESDSDVEDRTSLLSGSTTTKTAISTAEEFQTTRTKRKAEGELLPARHEKREKVSVEDTAVVEKPISRALQLAKERAAAKKAAAAKANA